MDRQWLYRAWRRVPAAVQRVLLWWGNARFVAGVLALILDDQGRVLLLRHDYRRVGQWGLPGGWLKAEENPESALVRELREETGLEIEVMAPLAVLRGDDMRRLDIIYRCRIVGGELKLGEEIAAARYYALEDLPASMFAEQVAQIRRAAGRKEA